MLDGRSTNWKASSVSQLKETYEEVRVIARRADEEVRKSDEKPSSSLARKRSGRPSLYPHARQVIVDFMNKDENWINYPSEQIINEFNDELNHQFKNSRPPSHRVGTRTLRKYLTIFRNELE